MKKGELAEYICLIMLLLAVFITFSFKTAYSLKRQKDTPGEFNNPKITSIVLDDGSEAVIVEREPLKDKGKESNGNVKPEFVQDEIIVKFNQGVTKDKKEMILSKLSIKNYHYKDKNKKKDGKKGLAIFDSLVHVKLKKDKSVKETLEELNDKTMHPDIEYAELNYIVSIDQFIPDDEHFSKLWGLHNTGQLIQLSDDKSIEGIPDADIDAPDAWTYATGNNHIVVAVIDTGIDYNHPDLSPNIWVNDREIPGNLIDDDNNGFIDDIHGYNFVYNTSDPIDDHFHGTHCAGTIGAVGNNGIGVAGVCWDVRLMALKFLSASGSGNTADAIKCIEYAINQGANVMSNSWGGGGFMQSLQDIINDAYQAGIVFVAAAGNNGTDKPHYPAAYDNVISVVALDYNDNKASFSNYGSSVDVAAPGVGIYSTSLEGDYRFASGTSMACPHVAGLVALLKSRNIDLTPDEVYLVLQSSADDLGALGKDETYGYGRINLYRAIQLVDEGREIPKLRIASPSAGSTIDGLVDIQGTATGSDFVSFTLEFSGPDSTEWNLLNHSSIPVENGILGQFDASDVKLSDGCYFFRLSVTDVYNNQFRVASTFTIDQIIATFYLDSFTRKDCDQLAIIGTSNVKIGTFDHFILEYSKKYTDNWSSDYVTLEGGGQDPISNNILGYIDLNSLDVGQYTIRLTAYRTDGKSDSMKKSTYFDKYIKPGWPKVIDGIFVHNDLAVADINGNNNQEIVVAMLGNESLFKAFDHQANSLFDFPNPDQDTDIGVTPALIDLFPDKGLEMAFNRWCYNNQYLHVIHEDYNLPNFSPDEDIIESGYNDARIMGQDIDGDNMADIFFAAVETNANKFKIYIKDYKAKDINGSPFIYDYPFPHLAGSAIGDLDGNGISEMFFMLLEAEDSSGYSKIQRATLLGLDNKGQILPGFPKDFYEFPDAEERHVQASNLVIADINRDGQKEILFIVSTVDGDNNRHSATYIINIKGEPLPNWPKEASGLWDIEKPYIAVGDVIDDEDLEIISKNQDYFINVYRADSSKVCTLGPYTNKFGINTYSPIENFSIVDLNNDGKGEVIYSKLVTYGPTTLSTIDRTILAYEVIASDKYFLNEPFLDILVPKTPIGNDNLLCLVSPSFVNVSDIDQDGKIELVQKYSGIVNSYNGIVTHGVIFAHDLPFNYSEDRMEWPTPQGNLGRTGEYKASLLPPCIKPRAFISVSPSLLGLSPFEVTFDASASADDEEIGTYNWDFDISNGIQVDATGITTTHVYNQPGKYIVTLQLVDNSGNKDVATVNITILSLGPIQTPLQNIEVTANIYEHTFYNPDEYNVQTGHRFTPLKDGYITKLYGYFNGTKKVFLWDSAQILIASAEVTSNYDWSYTSIDPIRVEAGKTYSIAVLLEKGMGGVRMSSITPHLPQQFEDIIINIGCHSFFTKSIEPQYPGRDERVYNYMVGLVDVDFLPIEGNENSPPQALNQQVKGFEDQGITITLDATDPYVDYLNYIIDKVPSNGVLPYPVGTPFTTSVIEYTPNANYYGTDSFTFKVNDGQADSNLATVSITINSVNDAPELSAIGNREVTVGESLNFTLTATDVENDSLTYSASLLPEGADLDTTIGIFSWMPTDQQIGEYQITFTVEDTNQGKDSESINIIVKNKPLNWYDFEAKLRDIPLASPLPAEDLTYVNHYPTNDIPFDIKELNNYLFLAAGQDGVQILDINQINLIDSISGYANGLDITDDILYVVDAQNKQLRAYQINFSGELSYIQQFSYEFFDAPIKIASNKSVEGFHDLYITNVNGELEVLKVDAAARSIGIDRIILSDLLSPISIEIYNNYAYIIEHEGWLSIYDMADALLPDFVTELPLEGRPVGLYITSEGLGYITITYNSNDPSSYGLGTIDMTKIDLPQSECWSGYIISKGQYTDVYVSGDRIYLSGLEYSEVTGTIETGLHVYEYYHLPECEDGECNGEETCLSCPQDCGECPNIPPEAMISANPASGDTPLTVYFDGTGSSDADGNIISHIWDFGDGNSANGLTVSHTYNTAGNFAAALTITDNDGATVSTQTTISVTEPPSQNQMPYAIISATPLQGGKPLVVSFDGSESFDEDGNIVQYNWDFGDDTSGDGITVTHEYPQAGRYITTLTIMDNDGDVNSNPASVIIKVTGIGNTN